jgi:catechol 2,3-dioxygenase-like lactoylglutathione lyase family enzyme
VDSIGFTVSDLDRSIEFYTNVLCFEKVSETEAAGPEYERLEGVFGLRMRTARMRLGAEYIELTEYLAPKGRPAPPDARANDRWFQHVAIITGDMDRAYRRLRSHKVQHASTGPQRLPDWNKNAGGIRPSISAIPMVISSRCCRFRRTKAIRSGISRPRDCFWE